MTGAVRVRVVVRELEAGHEQEAEGRERADALALDLREVGADVCGVDARAPVQQRPRIVAAQDVIGDAEDVEAALLYRSTAAPSESSPSLQVVWAWNSQSRGALLRACTPSVPAACGRWVNAK